MIVIELLETREKNKVATDSHQVEKIRNEESMKPEFQSTADRRVLEKRSYLLQQLRKFFLNLDFVEVETPILSNDSVIDLYLDPMVVPTDSGQRFLQTSPEFAMKRLLASGLPRIFQLTRAFRQGERGQYHNPEFSMLEWYRCGDDYSQGRRLLCDLTDTLLSDEFWRLGNPFPCRELTFQQAFQEALQLDPIESSDGELTQAAIQRGLVDCEQVPSPNPRRDAVHFLWSTDVDHQLGLDGPVVIYDWPEEDAALAQLGRRIARDGSPYWVAHRYELYYRGLELANGYHELLDPQVLRERNRIANQQRQQLNKPQLPEESRLLQAMDAGLPASSGVALGVDRLLMALLNLNDITQVIPFPWENA